MGELVRCPLGTMPETVGETSSSASPTTRRRPTTTAPQLEGHYYFAETAARRGPAFQALQNQIIRLSK